MIRENVQRSAVVFEKINIERPMRPLAPRWTEVHTPPIMPGGGIPGRGGGGRIIGAADTWGLGIIIPGAGPPTPRAGPASPYDQRKEHQSSPQVL